MEKRFLTPGEVAKAIVNVNVKRAKLQTKSCIILGILAGIFIGFGATGSILISQSIGNLDPGLAKFMSAIVFPVGLMLIVMCGGELFTGNNLMTLALIDKKITIKDVLRNWSIVYVANFIGAIILALVIFYSGTISGDGINKAIAIAQSKVDLSILQMFLRAIMCNMIVVLAVWMATAAQDVASKILACWFPIMLFVLCGFEHSIANMFFIPMGMLLGADVTLTGFIINLVVVTIGNIVGGAIIIPYMYHSCYLKENKEKETNK